MEYDWSWLPPRNHTTPPPLKPSSEQLREVRVLDETHPRWSHMHKPRHFTRAFEHDDVENERPDHFISATGVNAVPRPQANRNQAAGGGGPGENDEDHENADEEDENGEDDEATGDEDHEDGEEDDGQDEEEGAFDPASVGLKEISNLASFTVSSYKPGSGVKELRDDDVHQFWQSDGPQPHRLNIHFIKRVEIRALRLYLDYELDESYTPTKIQISAGFGPNLTIPFTTMELNMPKGWIDVPIVGAGGGPDGNSLCCWFVRIIILENHQNGKDTHLRGVKVYALDDNADTAENNPVEDMVEAIDEYEDRMTRMDIHDDDDDAIQKHDAEVQRRKARAKKYAPGDGGLSVPDFMREGEIR